MLYVQILAIIFCLDGRIKQSWQMLLEHMYIIENIKRLMIIKVCTFQTINFKSKL